jgi:hypothetical protein
MKGRENLPYQDDWAGLADTGLLITPRRAG